MSLLSEEQSKTVGEAVERLLAQANASLAQLKGQRDAAISQRDELRRELQNLLNGFQAGTFVISPDHFNIAVLKDFTVALTKAEVAIARAQP